MANPRVSVIMATYNHAPFVADAIQSVLSQDFDDFEFVIADDGSGDGTRDVVDRVQDSRIRFYPNTINRGACVVTNELIERSTGEYIALINSDDCWLQGKLSRQVQFLDAHPYIAASFGRPRFMDKDGRPLEKSTLAFGTVFDQPNRSRGLWLRRFLDEGNCVCHPTMLIRREAYGRLGLYDNRYRQLPDLDMWVRFVKHFALHISEQEMIAFRIMPGENASSQTATNAIRTMNEHFLIAKSFFDDVSAELLIEGFADRLLRKDIPTPEHLDIEKTLLFFGHNQWLGHTYKLVGLEQMFKLLGSRAHRDLLERDYQINDRTFQKWVGEADALRPTFSFGGVSTRNLAGELVRRVRGKLGRT